MRKIKKMRNDSCRKRTVTTVTVTEMGMKSTKQLYCKKKGLYTLLSRCIDPWNNRKVWVDNYFSDDQLIFFLFGQEETKSLLFYLFTFLPLKNPRKSLQVWK